MVVDIERKLSIVTSLATGLIHQRWGEVFSWMGSENGPARGKQMALPRQQVRLSNHGRKPARGLERLSKAHP